ncbi:hypothetical protein [Hathewaya limosa]|uniref:ABC-2 family transporter protein n=1 Tax=Hathewaya limosa TaxID=1536 RepID=A0ABU0JNM4_HATLI|nr:hypothetical protein [Hathewaya limosa]AWZ49700.1 hypothetical protein C3495_13230 [Clostridiaceae bacterium 14S0207]MDQ0478687.1 hypothetical protein [Hathewaya limosa]
MYKRFLKIEFKRTFFSHRMLMALVMFMSIFIYISTRYKLNVPINPSYSKNQILEQSNCFINFLNTMGNPLESFMCLVFPLIILLVVGDSLFLDYKTSFLKFSITRINYKKYIFYKTTAIASIAFVFSLVFQILAFIYSVISTPFYLPTKMSIIEEIAPKCNGELFVRSPFAYIGLTMIILSLIATVISVVGVLTSSISKNSFSVIGAPWLIYILGSEIIYIIGPDLLDAMQYINPMNMMGPVLFMESTKLIYVVIYWMVLLVGISAISYRLALRKFNLGL